MISTLTILIFVEEFYRADEIGLKVYKGVIARKDRTDLQTSTHNGKASPTRFSLKKPDRVLYFTEQTKSRDNSS